MLSSHILSVVTFVYGLAFLLFILHLLFKRNFLNTAGDIAVSVGCSAHGAALILRWAESYRIGWGHVPLSNLYESLIFFSFLLAVVYLVFRLATKRKFLGVFMIPLPLLALGYASLSPDVERAISPLVPALQSNWLTIHVLTCFMAYAAFAFSFVAAVLYLVKKEGKEGVLPPPEALDDLVYRGIMAGMPLLTLGIITGSAWAHYAWGSYWSWDPKETWSLITWIVYAIFLHLRLMGRWRGTRSAVLSIVGFFTVIFTFLGVNYILSGLHSYL
ncbi:MAG: c-type cytochrome biogenesis protein CcsB [Deltaproteobacteria bacterium]|uniref:C-type cytochrome biogenesis protein CcsB n=1 Tax=Candidatus Zymogenus saltonus TaxID=2844893 RepID=A0A9D8PM72_9DELT|nr:c-type cytochrome biogenesis protein CcsB [Candidatus Zymogenus saltonus]